MRVHLGPYVDWIGPYQLAEKICFWVEKYEDEKWDDRVHKLGEFFAHGFHKKTKPEGGVWSLTRGEERPKTWLYKLLEWIHSKRKRTMIIKTDPWDHWNVDSTLSPIILPLLKDLKEHKHGSGYIDLEDVPEHLRFTETEDHYSQLCLDFYHAEGVDKLKCDVHTRYSWFLDELIWTFEQLQPDYDWEEQYRSGEMDLYFEKCSDNPEYSEMKHGPNHTYEVDWDAHMKHAERINNGLRLFGKYYQTLWD